jgi:hypothetical protein
MPDQFAQTLHDWQTFYILVGTAAATLIGLVFIAASLGASSSTVYSSETIHTWVTPTIIYLGTDLMLAALEAVPTLTVGAMRILLGLGGLAGLTYASSVAVRMRRPTQTPVIRSELIWHVPVPIACYLLILISAIGLSENSNPMLDVLAISCALLLILGIRNAWSMTTWIAAQRHR